MPQCQFLFIMSVYCRKGPKTKVLGKIQKNHRNSISPEDSRSQKGKPGGGPGPPPHRSARPEGSQGGPTQHGGAATRGGAPPYCVAPPWPLRLRLFSYLSRPDLKLRHGLTKLQKTFQSHRHRETPIRGTKVSVPALCRDGELPPEAISTAIFTAIAVSMTRRE